MNRVAPGTHIWHQPVQHKMQLPHILPSNADNVCDSFSNLTPLIVIIMELDFPSTASHGHVNVHRKAQHRRTGKMLRQRASHKATGLLLSSHLLVDIHLLVQNIGYRLQHLLKAGVLEIVSHCGCQLSARSCQACWAAKIPSTPQALINLSSTAQGLGFFARLHLSVNKAQANSSAQDPH